MYKCIKCRNVVESIEWSVRCPFCGARVLSKMRPSVPKKVRAR